MVSLGFKLIIHAKTGECQTVHQYRVSDQGCEQNKANKAVPGTESSFYLSTTRQDVNLLE